MRIKELSNKSAKIFIDEETSKDEETKHRKEKVAWLVLWGDEETMTNMITTNDLKYGKSDKKRVLETETAMEGNED